MTSSAPKTSGVPPSSTSAPSSTSTPANANSNANTNAVVNNGISYRLPDDTTLKNAVKLSIVEEPSHYDGLLDRFTG